MKKASIAILASGEGTTAEAFIRAGVAERVSAQVTLVICNNKKAGVFERIESLNKTLGLDIKTFLINGKNYPPTKGEVVTPGEQTSAEEAAILKALEDAQIDLVALMGYMKKVGSRLVSRFGWRHEYTDPRQAMMVNTHPGLLPETKGLYGIHVQEYVLQKELKFSGQTLHIVAEDYDEGPILAEHKVAVRSDDTPESLFQRVREAEKKYLPGDIAAFLEARKAYRAKEHE